MQNTIAAMMGMSLIAMLFLTAFIIMWIISIVDATKSEFRDNNNKIIWIIMLLLIPPLGTILYMAIGKSQKANYVELVPMPTEPRRKESNRNKEAPKPF